VLGSALRGAFVRLDAGLAGFAPNIIVFQFNPDTISRTPSLVQPPAPASGSGQTDPGAQAAEPTESISFSLRLDATDQLAEGNPIALASGILPTLSALELLMYPKDSLASQLFSAAASAATSIASAAGGDGGDGGGAHQHPPQELPTVLFFWGAWRILPVAITSLSINETLYDQMLNPVRAEVSVNLEVLTLSQLGADATFARGAYKYTQSAKEAFSVANLLNAPDIIIRTIASF
jgi:hypothetical protein